MIELNYRDGRPIYEQVRDKFRQLILSGALPPGYKMPSVRELAASLAINPNTIQRAYRELEASGYIYSVPGKGNFAGARHEVDDKRRNALLETLKTTVRELRYLGVTEEELLRHVSEGGTSDD